MPAEPTREAERYCCVKLEKEGAIDWLTLNRPEQLNALDYALTGELLDYFHRLKDDNATRVVVLRGAGRHFCAGLDLKEADATDTRGGVAAALKRQRALAEVIVRMRRAPQPIISLVHGAAAGGGFALALAADVRYAGKSARMNVAMAKIGLTGCDLGISYHLTRAVGQSTASELMLTGRFIDAARALRTGLVCNVVPDDQLETTGRALALDMLRMSPIGLRFSKEGVNFALDASSLEAAIAMEDRQQLVAAATADYAEGVAAFLEKREPRYRGI